MFTGIVAGMGRICHIEGNDVIRIIIDFGMVFFSVITCFYKHVIC